MNQIRSPAEDRGQGGVLAVWGSPGSGKTAAAAQIARHLAEKGIPVILFLCDMTAPMLPCLCPPDQTSTERSLGSLLAADPVTPSLIEYNLTAYGPLPKLSLLGLRKGESEYTFPACTKDQAKSILDGLRSLATWVVADCSSYIADDILSAVTLLEADAVLRLDGSDLKAVSYFSSQIPLLRAVRWEEEKQYKVSSHPRLMGPAIRVRKAEGEAAFRLPYTKELSYNYQNGDLLEKLTKKDSRNYQSAIEQICKEVLGC